MEVGIVSEAARAAPLSAAGEVWKSRRADQALDDTKVGPSRFVMSRHIPRPDPSGNMKSNTINLTSFDLRAAVRVRLSEASVTRNPCSARYRPRSFRISRSSSTIRIWDSSCTRSCPHRNGFRSNKALAHGRSTREASNRLPATLRYIPAVLRQCSETDGPNFEGCRALKLSARVRMLRWCAKMRSRHVWSFQKPNGCFRGRAGYALSCLDRGAGSRLHNWCRR